MRLDGAGRADVVRRRRWSGTDGRGSGLRAGRGPGCLLGGADERGAVRGPEGARDVEVVRRGACGTGSRAGGGGSGCAGCARLAVRGRLGGEVPEGLPEDLEAGLEEREGVGLDGGDVRVDVGLVLEEERLEVGGEDPGRAL